MHKMVGGWVPASAGRRATPTIYAASDPSAQKPTNGSVVLSTPLIAPPATSTAKLQLLQMSSGFDRGALANASAKQYIGDLVSQLEASFTPPPLATMRTALEGRWQLVYSSVEQFRSSPFFWAFAEGLVGNRTVAGAIFAFTDSIPGARVGEAYQTITFTPAGDGRLLSEVKLEVFPGLSGFVVTDSAINSLDPAGTLALTVESTRVADTNVTQVVACVFIPAQYLYHSFWKALWCQWSKSSTRFGATRQPPMCGQW